MIASNSRVNQYVSEPRAKNFYPKNPPLSAASMSSALTASQENFFRKTDSLRYAQQNNANKRQVGNFFSPKQSSQYSHYSNAPIGDTQSWQVQSWYAQSVQQQQQQPNRTFSSYQDQDSRSRQQQQQQDNKQQNFQNTGSLFFQQQTDEIRDKLNESRRQRQEVDQSVENLKNRVNLLEMEEQRTVQKMVDTQKKTIEIITNQTSHMERLAEKNEQRLRRTEDIVKRQLELKEMREEKRNRDDLMKNMRAQSAKMSVQRIKNLKDQYSIHQQTMAQEMLLRKTQSYLTVKASERELDMKKQQLQESRKSLAHQIYTSKCKSEIQKKTQSQLSISELERKEAELLKKLQFSQKLQQSALTEMQKASKSNMNLKPSQSFTHANDPHVYYLSN